MKKKLIVAVLAIASLSGCAATSVADAYTTAAQVNDASFKAAMFRVCGLTSSLAANRILTPVGKQYHTAMCKQWDIVIGVSTSTVGIAALPNG